MFLLYVDASGTPDHPGQLPTYAMAGVCIHEGTWHALEKRIAGLKRNYALGERDFEIHCKDFCQDFREQRAIPEFEQLEPWARRSEVLRIREFKLKEACDSKTRRARKSKYRESDPFIHMTRLQRSRLLEDTLDLAGSHDGLRLFGEIVDKRQLGQPNALQHTFTQLVTRFDYFLDHYSRNRDDGEAPQRGLVVMDREPTYEKYLADLFDSYQDSGHPWGRLRHVIETPFFIDSKRGSAIQLADACSYALRRYVERAATDGTFEEQNFRRIFHKFDRSGPKLHGLRHFCARGSCRCLICRERGHVHESPSPVGPSPDPD